MLWIGTYARKGGAGLVPLALAGGALRSGEAETRIANASFGTWSPRTRTAYFVDEQDAGRVTAWRRTDGGWQPHGICASGGALPCFLALDPRERWLAVANYGDGSLALVALDPADGRVGGLSDVAHHVGSGPDADRQASPHVHCVLFDETGEWLYAVDLGADRVFRHAVGEGRLGPAEVAFAAPPGTGPRHLLLHPDGRHALLLTELSAELMLLERTAGELHLMQTLSTMPERTGADNLGGHLALAHDGRLLVTNRGHDSIVAFLLADGRLRLGDWQRTSGVSPRHFVAGADAAVIAHENSGDVTLVPFETDDGEHRGDSRRVALPGAAFVIDIPD